MYYDIPLSSTLWNVCGTPYAAVSDHAFRTDIACRPLRSEAGCRFRQNKWRITFTTRRRKRADPPTRFASACVSIESREIIRSGFHVPVEMNGLFTATDIGGEAAFSPADDDELSSAHDDGVPSAPQKALSLMQMKYLVAHQRVPSDPPLPGPTTPRHQHTPRLALGIRCHLTTGGRERNMPVLLSKGPFPVNADPMIDRLLLAHRPRANDALAIVLRRVAHAHSRQLGIDHRIDVSSWSSFRIAL